MTKVINLFGGPGCGKSTGAAYIFSLLKMKGMNVELVTEFAKDKTWEHNSKALTCQPYVFGKQSYRMDRCADEVDIIITDSPLFLSAMYNFDSNIEPEFTQTVIKKFNEFENYNFFLKRLKEYNPKGRNQTEEEAKELDNKIKTNLNKFNIEYEEVNGCKEGYEYILNLILSK
jgi:ABC-type dipeptide/oligopeptide/nickel transport system ATPase component